MSRLSRELRNVLKPEDARKMLENLRTRALSGDVAVTVFLLKHYDWGKKKRPSKARKDPPIKRGPAEDMDSPDNLARISILQTLDTVGRRSAGALAKMIGESPDTVVRLLDHRWFAAHEGTFGPSSHAYAEVLRKEEE